jgi:hypothetical protein
MIQKNENGFKYEPSTEVNEIHAEKFVQYLIEASTHNRHAEFFHMYSAREYSEMRMFVIDSGVAGFAIKRSGELVSVFKNEELANRYSIKKVADIIIPRAIHEGAKKLDYYSGLLDLLYARYGFTPVCKIGFNPEHAPLGWKYEIYGKPDIVFMAYVGGQHNVGNIPYVDSYDCGYALTDSFIQ